MFIQTELTPNPNSLKFIPGVEIAPRAPVSYISAEEAGNSLLARKLFSISGVESLFFGSDFITITKSDSYRWETLKAEILSNIMDHLVSGLPIFENEAPTYSNSAKDEDSEIIKEIKELIETRVRPAVAADGGDIIFHSYNEGVVKLELHGSCSGCPSSTITLKSGIENMLKYYIPEIIAVEAI